MCSPLPDREVRHSLNSEISVHNFIYSHEQALKYAQEAGDLMQSLLEDSLEYALDASKRIEIHNQEDEQTQEQQKQPHIQAPSNKRTLSREVLDKLAFEQRRNSKSEVFKEEIDFLNRLLEYALPFLIDINKRFLGFTSRAGSDPLMNSKKSLFNWKIIQENNEKYFRKEFKKNDLPDQVNSKRNILGVQHKLEWLENLNIGAMMHMKPTKYKDYASKKDLTYEITREALQEKVFN